MLNRESWRAKHDAGGYRSGSGRGHRIVRLSCKALRGQGYALVELHRLDDAAAAYKACLKLEPGEPKSLGELGYIDGLRAKSH
jgi:Flp pilus assembly protein TadD